MGQKQSGMNLPTTTEEKAMIHELKDMLGLNNAKAAVMVAVKAMWKKEKRK